MNNYFIQTVYECSDKTTFTESGSWIALGICMLLAIIGFLIGSRRLG